MVAATTIIAILAVAGIALGGTAFLGELNQLVNTIVGNFFYMGLISISIIIAFAFFKLVEQGNLTPRQAGIGAVFVMVLALLAPLTGFKLTQAATSYSVTLEADVDQPTTLNTVDYNGLNVVSVQRSGPDTFELVRDYQACLIFCGDWEVETTVSCNGEPQGVTSITGTGGQNSQGKVSGLPSNSQCYAQGEMIRPQNHAGDNSDTVAFTTGQ